jgi:hypothetical protein
MAVSQLDFGSFHCGAIFSISNIVGGLSSFSLYHVLSKFNLNPYCIKEENN